MNTDLIVQTIARHISLTPSEVVRFKACLQQKTIKRKSFLVKPGEVCQYETFVVKGCLRVYHVDAGGSEHILYFAVEGWWAEDLCSFLTQTPAEYAIEALEDSELLQIHKDELDRLFEDVPKFERFFRIALQNAYIAHQQRIRQHLSLTAEERYRQFTRKYPQLEQRIAQKHIATYLGVAPESLSFIRHNMVRN